MGTPGHVVLSPAAAGLPWRRRRGWDHTSIRRPDEECLPRWEGSWWLLLASEAEGEDGVVQPGGSLVVSELTAQAAPGWQLRERAAVALADGASS
jgi:hypothetical protein